jgi:Mce-associated membrane protein
LAEQAEAEAAEAEALAVAARARARAIQMRRQADLLQAKEAAQVVSAADPTAEHASDKEAPVQDEADAPDSAQTEVHDTREIEPDGTGSADDPESIESQEGPHDAVAEPEADTLSDGATPEKRRWLRRPKRSTLAAGLAIIVVLAALSGSVYMVWEHRGADRQRQRVAEFAAAARQGVVTLTSLDFNSAKQGVQRIVENSTGTFKDDFLKMADDFAKVVEQSKVVEQGKVEAAAVDLDSMTNDSAVVLVASTSEVTNAAGAKQDPRNYRLIVTITRDGDQLKMSKVEFVP